jgi:hypothetical protein
MSATPETGHTTTDSGTAATWRPDQGGHPRTIVGALVDVRSVSGAFGPCPLVELEADDGVMWHIHAFRDVLRSELANAAPQPGDRISISYGGKSEKGYYLYRVRHADGRSRQVNWSTFADSPAPIEPDLPVPDVELPSAEAPKAEAPEPQAPLPGETSNPPFLWDGPVDWLDRKATWAR